MPKSDFISVADFSAQRLEHLLATAFSFKRDGPTPYLSGKTLALLFEKPSLRTRVSFDVGMHQLGGHTIYLGPTEVGLGNREPVEDVARVLSRYVDVIVARTYSHHTVEGLAKFCSIPVINGLSDVEHPCQAIGDFLTIREKLGRVSDVNIAYIGDGNNVATSLLYASALFGANFRFASPEGYELPDAVAARARLLQRNGGRIEFIADPVRAVKDADVVYTDVWTSMGSEAEADVRKDDFQGFQVTPALLAAAKPNAIFMHPLPAHDGEEVSDGLLSHPQSVVFDQAENRMHAQKAILVELLSADTRR